MKIKTIRPQDYFIDTINVNFHFSIANATMKNKKEILTYVPILRKYIFNEYNNVQSKGISVQKTTFPGNLAIHYRGSFWKETRKAIDDIQIWFAEYLKLEELVIQHFNRHCHLDIHEYKPHITVSRFDFARNHKGNMTNAIPICQKNIKNINYWAENTTVKPYIYGLAIGKRTNGTYFRSYDKRFDKDGYLSSLERFKSIDYVRKEWELKSDTLRRYGITSPLDLVKSVQDTAIFSEIIFRSRKNRDIIMKTDGMLYRSIHDDLSKLVINKTDGFTINEHEFNEMIQRDYNVFLNKPTAHELERHAFNPMPQLKGLLKKEFTHKEILQIFEIMKNKMSVYDSNYFENTDNEENYEDRIKSMLEYINDKKKLMMRAEDSVYKKGDFNDAYKMNKKKHTQKAY